jgi:hypothetical protein
MAAPLAVVVCAGALAAVPCALAGAIVARPGALVSVALLAMLTVGLCAALSARRGGRMPLSVLFFASGSDPSGGGIVVLLWLIAWPATAALVGGGALHLASRAHGTGTALILALAAPVVLGYLLGGSQA